MKKGKSFNRRQAVAWRCLDCGGGSYSARSNCHHVICQLHPYRTGQGKQDATARKQAIRTYCKDFCMADSTAYVSTCSSPDCVLYAFRLSRVANVGEVVA